MVKVYFGPPKTIATNLLCTSISELNGNEKEFLMFYCAKIKLFPGDWKSFHC